MTINADEKLNDIMWNGQQIEALLRGIQALTNDGTTPDSTSCQEQPQPKRMWSRQLHGQGRAQ